MCMRKVILIIAASLAVICNAAQYPSTYPFENEVWTFEYEPLPIPVDELMMTFDDTDLGGYAALGFEHCDLNKYEDLGWGVGLAIENVCYGPSYYFVTVYGVPPVLPVQTFNCTGRPVYGPDSFTGKIGQNSICDVGSCCSNWYGVEGFSTGDALVFESLWATTSEVGGCATMDEATYCMSVLTGAWHCFTNWYSGSERAAIGACWLNNALWYSTCTVYNVIGWYDINWVSGMEPTVYLDTLTPFQSSLVEALTDNPDRVCYPPSYYGDMYAAYYGESETTDNSAATSRILSVALIILVSLMYT